MVDGVKWISFDNERSVKLKAKLALDLNLAGVMVWSIETDDFNGESSRVSSIYILHNLIRTSIVTYLWGHRSIANIY